MSSRKLKTNEDLMKDLMNYSPYGALCQAFITQALTYYCDEVIKEKDKMIKDDEEKIKQGKIPLISAKAWTGIAEDIKQRMDEFYNRK